MLEGSCNALPGYNMGFQTQQILPLETNRAKGRGYRSGDTVEECRFTCTVGANEADNFPIIYLHGNMAQCLKSAEILGNLSNLKQSHSQKFSPLSQILPVKIPSC